jgi:clorobiocin biosynthesis protein CloN6
MATIQAQSIQSAPDAAASIRADLILLHAPSVLDFRERHDVVFPYIASDSVAVSSIFEIYPLGFKSIEAYLSRNGFSVRIINLAALMIRKWDLDVRQFLASLQARAFGIDLHWVIHAHGSVELAKLLKDIHPRIPTLFGGISSTYYARELMQYPQVDLVLRGFDTHEPLLQLMRALKDRTGLEGIPNLLYRSKEGGVQVNDFSHKPRTLGCDTAADWSPFLDSRERQDPAMMVLPSTGCAHNCGWCGGSHDAVVRIMETRRTVAARPPEAIMVEMQSMRRPAAKRANVYTLNAYNFSARTLDAYLAGIKAAGIRDVSYEQFRLTPMDTLRRMVDAARTTINLSPESHDREISRLAGRGNFSMEEMERWIEQALAAGVFGVHIWFFIGMPKQTASSVADTVAYCRQLMLRFKGRRVIPLLTPMVPFLDPGCNYFENPDHWGYKVFFRSLEEHRRALVCPSWIHRINFETRWLSRERIATVSYDAIDAMTRAKVDVGMLPAGIARELLNRRMSEKELLFRVGNLWEREGTEAVVRTYGEEVRRFNERAFRAGVADQIFPIPRSLDNRWFDEFEIQ